MLRSRIGGILRRDIPNLPPGPIFEVCFRVARGEFKNPRRDVAFALLVEISIVTLLYMAVQWIALGTVPNLGSSPTPLADGARIFLGGWGGLLLTAAATVVGLGLLASASWTNLLAGAAAAAIGGTIYALRRPNCEG